MNRIVVIEDDPAILRGLADSLRSEAYEVRTASDGADGYRIVRENPPDLVILDLMLPGMHGYDVCRQMRHHGLVTPILMLTAQDREMDRVQGFDAGADDYVTKPFSLRELLGRVRAILRRSEGRSDLRNQEELNEARAIQQRLMPSELPQLQGCSIAGRCIPSRLVGGDYFDAFKLDADAIAVCIADVCGKGMPAAMIMANLQAAVKASVGTQVPPAELCERINRVMCENLAGNGFITFFYGVIRSLEDGRKHLTYCNAGHNPPILFTGSKSLRRLDDGGGILGVFPEWHYDEDNVVLSPGNRLLIYTDGITESRGPSGEEFGEERLVDLVRDTNGGATALAEAAVTAATHFSNTAFEDDMTVLAVVVGEHED